MGTVDDGDKGIQNTAAVRIELTNDDGTIAPPAPVGGSRDGRSPSGRIAFIALAIAFGLVAILVLRIRPDDGQTAAGTPITAPTTMAPEVDDDQTSGEAALGEQESVNNDGALDDGTTDDAPLEFESVAFAPFMFTILEAEFGWISLAFSNGDDAGLWRSTDGLEWKPLPRDTLPTGDLIGFDRIDGVYLLAVDEAESWSSGGIDSGDESFPEHRITIWESSNALNWFPTTRPALEGFGFPYPASFTRDTYVVPMVVPPEGGNPLVIEYLAPFVDAPTALRVCSLRRTFVDDVQSVIFDDCDGQPVAEISELDHPDDFDRLESYSCLQVALQQGSQRGVSIIVPSDGSPQAVELDATFGIFGRAVDSGIVARSGFTFNAQLGPECGGEPDQSDEPRAVYWSAELGEVDVTPAGSFDVPFAAQQMSIVRDEDERIRFASNEGIWVGDAPFDRWELHVAAPDPPPAFQGERSRDLSMSHDGHAAVVHSLGELHVWVEGRDWETVAFTGLADPRLLLATDEFVVVTGQSRAGTELVKVPLP